MKHVAIFTGGGLVALLAGLAVFYLFMKDLGNGANYLFLGGSLVLVGGGITCLILATRQPKPVVEPESNWLDDGKLEQMLQRNNQIASEWNETNKKRDHMKMLEISASAAQQETNN